MSVSGILGKKIGMTQVFDDRGDVHPVTVLKAGPCVITQLKTLAKDGYDAAQIGYVDFVKASKVNKAMTGHFAKSNVPPVRMIKEVALEAVKPAEGEEAVAVKAGDRVLVDIFNDEKFVDVIGTSKGRGFAGVIRRHGFGGGPKSHGHMFQVQGSIGASSFPSRVFPRPAHARPHGPRADHGPQPPHPRHRSRGQPPHGRRRSSRPARWIRSHLQGQGAAA